MAPNEKEKDKTDKRGPFSFSRKHRFPEREFQDGTELRFKLGKVESWGRGRTKIFMGKRGTSFPFPFFCVVAEGFPCRQRGGGGRGRADRPGKWKWAQENKMGDEKGRKRGWTPPEEQRKNGKTKRKLRGVAVVYCSPRAAFADCRASWVKGKKKAGRGGGFAWLSSPNVFSKSTVEFVRFHVGDHDRRKKGFLRNSARAVWRDTVVESCGIKTATAAVSFRAST